MTVQISSHVISWLLGSLSEVLLYVGSSTFSSTSTERHSSLLDRSIILHMIQALASCIIFVAPLSDLLQPAPLVSLEQRICELGLKATLKFLSAKRSMGQIRSHNLCGVSIRRIKLSSPNQPYEIWDTMAGNWTGIETDQDLEL